MSAFPAAGPVLLDDQSLPGPPRRSRPDRRPSDSARAHHRPKERTAPMTRLHDHLAEAIKDPDPIRVRARGDHPGDDLICLRFETMKVYSALGAVQAPVENREGAPRGYADRQLERDLRPCFGPGL